MLLGKAPKTPSIFFTTKSHNVALRIFKKKNGKPTGFAKVIKGLGKAASIVASVAPIPAGSKVGKLLSRASDAIAQKTNGQVNAEGIEIQEGETLREYVARQEVGAGAAVAAFTDSNLNAPNPSSPLSPLEQGFMQTKTAKYGMYALIAVVVGGVVYKLFKK